MRAAMNAFLTLMVILFAAAPALAQSEFKSGFHLDWWKSDSGQSATQYHIPIEVSTEWGDFGFKVLTAYVQNDVEGSDGSDLSFGGVVDTRVNCDYAVVDRWPVDVLFALDLNLPTGQTGLSSAEAVSISNPDTVTITRMGEGLNVNPSISIVKQWDSLLVAVGLGAVIRGQYDAADSLKDYDPGDARQLTAALEYHFSDRLATQISGSHTEFDKDRLDGDDYYQPGNVNIFGLGITYAMDRWSLNGSVKTVSREKNELSTASGKLISEDHNSYGDERIADLSCRIKITEKTEAALAFQYLTLSENGYPPTHAFYASDRTKTTFGVEVSHRLGSAWELGVRLQKYTTAVDRNPVDDDDTDFDGGTAALWIAARF